MSEPLIQVVLAKIEQDMIVAAPYRADLGQRPKMQAVSRPVAVMWASECDAADYDSACRYAATEGYQVFCYGQDEADPLGRAKADVLA
jgi:hypothetical protein